MASFLTSWWRQRRGEADASEESSSVLVAELADRPEDLLVEMVRQAGTPLHGAGFEVELVPILIYKLYEGLARDVYERTRHLDLALAELADPSASPSLLRDVASCHLRLREVRRELALELVRRGRVTSRRARALEGRLDFVRNTLARHRAGAGSDAGVGVEEKPG